METLTSNPAFQTYALCASIIVLKMILSAIYTSAMRLSHASYVNEEDARAFGKPADAAAAVEAPQVAHALRIQRNDGENILPFLTIALIYVLSGASAVGAAAYCWTFTAARVLHTIVYMMHLQPWRAICFFVGLLCMLGMIANIVINVL